MNKKMLAAKDTNQTTASDKKNDAASMSMSMIIFIWRPLLLLGNSSVAYPATLLRCSIIISEGRAGR
jgi:hypothetical protein